LKYVLIPRQDQEATIRELKNWDLCVHALLLPVGVRCCCLALPTAWCWYLLH
jgi:hypothetical protein